MNYNARYLRAIALNLLAVSALVFSLKLAAYAGDDWQPVSPEELKMTSEPKAPGAPAIYLYRQVDRNDAENREIFYERIKVLTEEGREYANVEIPFLKGRDKIKDIRARSIQPDGRIFDLDEKVYEKTIVKTIGVKVLAKTFTVPGVQVGSIVEYRYVNEMSSGYFYDSYWILSSDLFTKLARFSLRPAQGAFDLLWRWPNGLPEGSQPPKDEHGAIRFETKDITAFLVEDYMPPERELKYRVDFVYRGRGSEKDETRYWEKYGRSRFLYNEDFVNKRDAMTEALATIVQPTDDAQTKLHKIYTRVQLLRNFSSERERTEQEAKRDKKRDVNDVVGVWKQGGGTGSEINYLFIGLVKAAGMEAFFVDVSTRDSHFFHPHSVDSNELNNNVVLVRLAGKDLYFDPGVLHMPFGLLPWSESGVIGLQSTKDGGPWITTPLPDSSVSKIVRKADLHLAEDGTLEGKLTVTYSGIEAVEIRSAGNDEDDVARKKILEDAVRESIPVEAEINLTNKPDWDSSLPAFVAEFTVKVRGWTSSAGRRELVPMGLFGGGEKRVFEHAYRVHPVYFHYASTKEDDVRVALPERWKIESLPAPLHKDQKAVEYSNKAEEDHGALHISRVLRLDVAIVDASNYPPLRNFFQFVRSGDEQQIVLQAASQPQ